MHNGEITIEYSKLGFGGGAMRKPLGIIFDVGDTIHEYVYNNHIKGTMKVLEHANYKHKINAQEIQDFSDKLTKEIFDKRDITSLEVSIGCFQRYLYEYFDITFEKDFDEIEKIFCVNAFRSKPTKGIYKLLETLEELKIKTGALSNSSFKEDTLKFELKQHSLDSKFDFFISSADYCFRKPSLHIFNLAIKKMGLSPEDIWFIGDSIEYDVKGAINAGLFPVWYNRKNQVYDGEWDFLEVKDMNEVTSLIEELYKCR